MVLCHSNFNLSFRTERSAVEKSRSMLVEQIKSNHFLS